MRVRRNINKILRKSWRSARVYPPLRVRRKIQRGRRRLVYALSNTERRVFKLTRYANNAIITHMKPHKRHGNHAEIGDLVKIYGKTGLDIGVMGIVIEVREFTSWTMETWKKIRINTSSQYWDAHLARIISKAGASE